MKFLIIIAVAIFSFSLAYGQNMQSEGGGYIIPQSKYPAAIQIFMGTKYMRCSASIVSPNVILTVAHCADFHGQTYSGGYFFIGKTKYNFKFYTHKDVMGKDFDIAVGIVERNIKGIKPFTISFDGQFGEKMISLGYGCTKKYLTESFLKTEISGSESRHLVSNDPDQQLFGCGADSGGPTLAYNQDLKLRITGVHFGSDIKTTKRKTTDWRTDTVEFLNFVQTLSEQKNLKICGYNLDCD